MSGSGAKSVVTLDALVLCSAALSFLAGTVVILWRRVMTPEETARPQWLGFLLITLGVLGIASASTKQSVPAILGWLTGSGVGLLSRDWTVTDCGSCADTTFVAILGHRAVEGILIAGIYVANAGLGVIAAAAVTGHAIAETVAIGEFYAATGWRWGLLSVVIPQLGFIAGALGGTVGATHVSEVVEILCFAGLRGVLLMASFIELSQKWTGRLPKPSRSHIDRR